MSPVEGSAGPRRGISVLTVTYNGEAFLPSLLASLDAQELDAEWEHVVVDNGSTDSTVRLLTEASGRHGVRRRVVDGSAKPGNIPFVRNLAARSASFDRLVYCDQDDVLERGWLAAAFDGLEDHEALMGLIHELSDDDEPRVMNPSVHGPRPVLESCNFAVRRSALERVGGFDEDLAGYGMDDSELAIRLAKAGITVVGEPRMRIRARRSTGFRERARKVYSSARTEITVWKKHRDVFPGHATFSYVLREALALPRAGLTAVTSSDPHSKDRWARQVITCCAHFHALLRPRR